ncbi:MAG: STAS domain-containing protein [Candidatus Methanogranum gryphiswaldense]|nr:MAG: STAS domain-containing protein [Candidatus Methanogranum sp. U3.2.1]
MRTQLSSGTLTLMPEGRLDTFTAQRFLNDVEPLLADADRVVIDLKDLQYISSAGLRAILAIQKRIGPKGGSVRIENACDFVAEVLSMTGFQELIGSE